MTDSLHLQGLPLREALLSVPEDSWIVLEEVTPRRGADPSGTFRILRCRQVGAMLILTVCRFPGLGRTHFPKEMKHASDT